MTNYAPIRRYHRTDAWCGHAIPACAVAGASDTGMWEDSPCPSGEVAKEVRKFQRTVLRPLGIKSRTRGGNTTNCFCGKRWLVVAREDFSRAAEAVVEWTKSPAYRDFRYMHDADLEKTEIREAA